MAKTTQTLKLGGAEPILPGLALPEAFESLDKRIESTVQFCRQKGSVESQILGLVTVCQEMQRLLKFAFIENGLLASRIEILTRHQMESLKKMDKKLSDVEIEHKVTKKQIKRLRRRLSEHETLQRKNSGEWWDVKVSSTDYDSLTTLSRSSGYPDLEFMLRINQILIDFVKDENKNELTLPPMGQDERAELSKIASIYKLRCRYGKSTNLAPSTLIKARQTCIPLTGEVDSLLENFAKNHRRVTLEDGSGVDVKPESPTKPESGGKGTDHQTPSSLPISDIPPTMLTPLSSLSSPNTIDIGSTPISVTPAQSPTSTSTSSSATDQSSKSHQTRKTTSSSSSTSNNSSSSGGGSAGTSSGVNSSNAHHQGTPKLAITKGGVQTHPHAQQQSGLVGSGSSESVSVSAALNIQRGTGSMLDLARAPLSSAAAISGGGGGATGEGVGGANDHVTPSKAAAGIMAATSIVQRQTPQSQGKIYLSHQGHLRPMVPPTVVASPLKFPLAHLPTTTTHGTATSNNSPGGGGGGSPGGGMAGSGEAGAGAGGVKRERESSTAVSSGSGGGTPSKRVRVTRKSASGNGEE